MVIVSEDITNPLLPPFITADHLVNNSDGSVSLAIDAAGTRFAGREPFTGNRNDSVGSPQAYQKFTIAGGCILVSQMTVPDGRTDIRAFSFVSGKSF